MYQIHIIGEAFTMKDIKKANELFDEGYDYMKRREENPEFFEKGLQCFIEAGKFGHDGAMCLAGYCYQYYKNGCEAEAVKFYEEAVRMGSAEAMYLLGKCYQLGKGVSKDEQKANNLLKEAKTKGNVFSFILSELNLA